MYSSSSQWHIKCWEAMAAFHAVKFFIRDRKSITVLNNTTAVAYMNKLCGTLSPRCMNRDIILTAEHLPGVLNTIADEESQVMKDRSDWMLDPRVFDQIKRKWGPLGVNLFASILITQLDRFFSWRSDPEPEAFNQDWTNLQGMGYANPLLNLVGRVLNRVREQKITMVLVAPVWKNQPWYSTLLEGMVIFPVLLPQRRDLIILTHPESVPEITPQLAAWLISGDATKAKRFQMRAQSCSLPPGKRSRQSHTTYYSGSRWTGAVNGIPIPFQDL